MSQDLSPTNEGFQSIAFDKMAQSTLLLELATRKREQFSNQRSPLQFNENLAYVG